MNERILLIEDDPGLVMALTDLLGNEGYAVNSQQNGAVGLQIATEESFDLIVLDVMLPGMGGFDVCRELRHRDVRTPVIMLTARGQVIDKVLGLKLGADDYLTKPFESLELLARIEALLRRMAAPVAGLQTPEVFRFGSVAVDFRSTEVRFKGEPVDLSAREFHLLRYFIEQRGATLTREHLLQAVWGYEALMLTRTVDVHVGLLRHKLERDVKNPRHFLTMRGLGYKFVS